MTTKALVILLIPALLSATIVWAQCPSPDSIRKYTNEVTHSTTLSPSEQLSRLLAFKERNGNCPSAIDSSYTRFLRQVGWIYYDQADYLGAANYFQQSINIITANIHKPSVQVRDLVNGYYYLALVYDALNNVAEKMKAAENCIDISFRLNASSEPSCIRSLYTKVEHLYDIGDYYQCIKNAEMCETQCTDYIRQATNEDYKKRMRPVAQSSIGWHVNALINLEKYDEAEKLLSDKITEYKKTGLKNYLALTYGQLAQVQEKKGNYTRSLRFFESAFAAYRDDHDNFNCKQVLNNIGEIIYFNRLHEYDKALAYYRKALQYINKDPARNETDSIETLSILGNIANVYIRKQSYDSAFAYFKMAFDHVRPGIDEQDILNSPHEEFIAYKKIPYLASLVIDKGDALREKYRVTRQPDAARAALKVYQAADALFNRISIEQSDLESKLFWRTDSRRLYEHAIDASYIQHDINSAFYFFEKSRAVLLNDQLSEQRWSDADIAKRAQVKKRILQLSNTPAADPQKQAAIQEELFTRNRELNQLEQQLRINNPFYSQRIDTASLTLAGVQKGLLKKKQVLLEIFSGDSTVYSLLITSQEAVLNKIDKNEFETTAASYIYYISNPSSLNTHFSEFRKIAYKLYLLLFPGRPVTAERIIISPEGRYFPVESLITDNSQADPVYFITHYAVSYTYSARYLANDFIAARANTGGNLLGFAPVYYNPDLNLPNLAGSDLSLKNIGEYIPGSNYLFSQNASRNNFLKQFPGYKIIQLYTHASDSSNKTEPVIYFADSALYLSELITDTKPVTRLIVLSACETGNGKLYQGEGVFSFNRGFAALGIPSSVANLWAVDNLSTYQLTEYFYKYLSQELPVDVALQKAKLEFLSKAAGEHKLPYYWAASVLVGKTDPVDVNHSSWWKLLLWSLVAIAAVWAVMRYRKTTK